MTAPNQNQTDDKGTASDKPAPAKSSTTSSGHKALDVVSYKLHDPITARDIEGFGVVLRAGGDNESVLIRPLADYYVEVDPADVATAAADEA